MQPHTDGFWKIQIEMLERWVRAWMNRDLILIVSDSILLMSFEKETKCIMTSHSLFLLPTFQCLVFVKSYVRYRRRGLSYLRTSYPPPLKSAKIPETV